MSTTTRSWWRDYNNTILSTRESGWGDEPLLSPKMCELLDHVDAAFAVTGAHTPGWPNPYKDGPGPDEQAYAHSSTPEKFRIVVARARAWTQVLLDRGWAREASRVDWALSPMEPGGADTILEPTAADAVPLVLTTHTPMDSKHPFNVTIAAGDPAVRLASLPDCACDGCDSGSAGLLKDMDMLILSVVDGSLDVDVGDDFYWVRTSFNVYGSGIQDRHEPTAFTAAPWPEQWTARPLKARPSLRRPGSPTVKCLRDGRNPALCPGRLLHPRLFAKYSSIAGWTSLVVTLAGAVLVLLARKNKSIVRADIPAPILGPEWRWQS